MPTRPSGDFKKDGLDNVAAYSLLPACYMPFDLPHLRHSRGIWSDLQSAQQKLVTKHLMAFATAILQFHYLFK